MYIATGGARLGGVLLMAGLSASVFADDHNASVAGIVTGTVQTVGDSHVDGEAVDGEGNGELFLLAALDMGPGAWRLEVRGSTTPRDNGVTRFYGSNALVGETLDANGDGRIAATQLFYELPAGRGQFRAGLLDPTAIFDGNTVANDEYTQFLAGAFVNNPSIAFPSFVLGGAYQGRVAQRLDYKLFLGSDSGLQAGARPTYRNVFDLGGNRAHGRDKGAFTQVELNYHAKGYALQAGVWYDTGEVARLGDTTGNDKGYGFYALAGAPLGPGFLQGRAGIANDKPQAAADFVSVSYQLPVQLPSRETTLGLAVGRTGDSDELVFDSDPIYQAEVYWRVNVAGPVHISPDIQYINNAGFQSNRHGVFIAGLRAGIGF